MGDRGAFRCRVPGAIGARARPAALAPEAGEPQESSGTKLLQWTAAPSTLWMHAANLDAARIKEIAAVVELPDVMMEAALRETSYPRLGSSERWCAFAVSLPGSQD